MYKIKQYIAKYSSPNFSSVTQSCPTLCDPWTAARQASLSITNSQSLIKFMAIELVMPSISKNRVVYLHVIPFTTKAILIILALGNSFQELSF